MGRLSRILGAASAAALIGSTAAASDTVTYSYDALGRLVDASTSGGPNDALTVATSYDPAGNRSRYIKTRAAGAASDPAGAEPLGGVGDLLLQDAAEATGEGEQAAPEPEQSAPPEAEPTIAAVPEFGR